MTYEDYKTAAMTFCKAESRNKEYMTLGLIGEVGEVANKMKKVIRDDAGQLSEEKRLAILDELGDVAWYCAGQDEVCGLYADMDDGLSYEGGTFEVFLDVVSTALDVVRYAELGNVNATRFYLECLLNCLNALAHEYGSTIEEVMQMNIAKLTSRQQRGKIGGSGDNR